MKAGKYTYSWAGLNNELKPVSGEIKAPSLKEARRQLHRASINIKKIRKTRSAYGVACGLEGTTISAKQICLFSRQLATMINAGLSLPESLASISSTNKNNALAKLANTISTEIEKGASLSQVLSNLSDFSDPLFVNLVAAGEESGTLDIMLNNIANHKEKTLNLKKKVTSAILYPALILVSSILVTSLLLIYIVPQFKHIFSNADASLPALTLFILDSSDFLHQQGLNILLCSLLLFFGTSLAKRKSSKTRHIADLLILKVPIIGSILIKSIFSRFSRTLSILFAAGVPLLSAIKLSSETMNNRALEKPMISVLSQIESGISLEQALRSSQVFPSFMLQMIASGEKSGRLEIMLEKAADFYENEVFSAIENLGHVLEPILILILGAIIATVVISMYLPIFKLASLF